MSCPDHDMESILIMEDGQVVAGRCEVCGLQAPNRLTEHGYWRIADDCEYDGSHR